MGGVRKPRSANLMFDVAANHGGHIVMAGLQRQALGGPAIAIVRERIQMGKQELDAVSIAVMGSLAQRVGRRGLEVADRNKEFDAFGVATGGGVAQRRADAILRGGGAYQQLDAFSMAVAGCGAKGGAVVSVGVGKREEQLDACGVAAAGSRIQGLGEVF